MKSVLSVTRDPVMRQVTLNFILVRVEGAWRSFNRIMVGSDRYVRNPAEIKHPEELVRVESVIQLWLAQQSGLLEQCRIQSPSFDGTQSSEEELILVRQPWTRLTKCGAEGLRESLVE